MSLDTLHWFEREKLIEVEYVSVDQEGWLTLPGGEKMRPGDSEWAPETGTSVMPVMGAPERECPADWAPTPGVLRYAGGDGSEHEVLFRWLDASRGCEQFVFHLLDGTKLSRPNIPIPESEHPAYQGTNGERLRKVAFARRRDRIRYLMEPENRSAAVEEPIATTSSTGEVGAR